VKFIDTNVIIRVLTNDEPHQSRIAKSEIKKCRAGEIFVSESVLTELFFVLGTHKEYLMSRHDICDALADLLVGQEFVISEKSQEALSIAKRHSRLDFTDCTLLAQSNFNKNHLLTLDKDLLKVLK